MATARQKARAPARGRGAKAEQGAAARAGVLRRIRVMISSRCNDPVPGEARRTLTDLRRAIKADLEAAALLGRQPFEVWINEDEPAQEGDRDAFQHCMAQAARADLVIALVNGRAGWAVEDGVGICHAELKRALDVAPARARVLDLQPRVKDAGPADRRFQAWLERQHLMTSQAATFDEAVDRARAIALDALLALAQEGARAAARGRFHSGDALAWSRLSYEERAARMQAAAEEATLARAGSRAAGGGVVARLAGGEVLLRFHAVPGPMSEPSARERVGRPFLHDHEAAGVVASLAGPVHVVACHRGVTENQAARMLGFPDAVLVAPPFGVWAADPVQKTQLLFLGQCRDETATRSAVDQAFQWLDASGEGAELLRRAEARARIVQAVAREAEPAKAAPRGPRPGAAAG